MIRDFNADEANNLALGRVGSEYINDTASHTGNFHAITIVSDAVFTTLTDSTRTGNSIGTDVFIAGLTIFGKFTEIQLASGKVIAYKEK